MMTPPLTLTLRRLRTQRALTQHQLAQRLGLTDVAISQWETGRYAPSLTHFIALASVLGIEPNELLGPPL